MEQHDQTKNKIDVYTCTLPQTHSFCISLYVKAGILYERDGETGITHFLEHIHFRGLGGMPLRALYKRLETIGADFNACTYKEFMYFYITAAPSHFHECAELAAMLLAPLTARESDVRAERKRVQSEIREEAELSSLAYFAEKEVWNGTGLGRLITGTVTGVNHINLQMLRAKKEELFTSDNLFFYVTGCCPAGSVDFLCREIEKYPVGSLSLNRRNTAPKPVGFQGRGAKVIVRTNDCMPGVRFTFDIDFSKYGFAEMDLLHSVMFSGELSRFKMRLSDESGLLYDFDPYFERYKNIGNIYVQYSVIQSRLYDSIAMTAGVFRSMKEKITPEDLSFVLPEYLDNNRMVLDRPQDLNWQMAYDNHIMDYGYKNLDELKNLYLSVTPERLMEIANEIFRPENLVVAIKASKKKTSPDRVREILFRLL